MGTTSAAPRAAARLRGATKVCAHCGLNPFIYCRGLCWTCYRLPGVKRRHACERALGAGHYRPPKLRACAPTDAPPGSDAKIAVMAARVAAKQELWHPRDPTVQRLPDEHLFPTAVDPAAAE